MDGHKDSSGKFHPHNDSSKSIHSSSIDSNTTVMMHKSQDKKSLKSKKLDNQWDIIKNTNNYTIWKSKKEPSIKMNMRWNPVTAKWQVYKTDGSIEIDDYGTFTDKNKHIAIAIAKNEMSNHQEYFEIF